MCAPLLQSKIGICFISRTKHNMLKCHYMCKGKGIWVLWIFLLFGHCFLGCEKGPMMEDRTVTIRSSCFTIFWSRSYHGPHPSGNLAFYNDCGSNNAKGYNFWEFDSWTHNFHATILSSWFDFNSHTRILPSFIGLNFILVWFFLISIKNYDHCRYFVFRFYSTHCSLT